MLVRIVKLTFNEESMDFFFQEFDKSKALITNFKGCRGMRMLQDMNQKNIVMTYSHWDDENALNNSEDIMYVIVEFMIDELSKHKEKTEYVLDIMNEVGGEEIYRKLQQAAMAQDKANNKNITQAANSTMKKLGINSQQQFVAEFENYKRRISNAESKVEKQKLLAEYKEKFKPILNDPSLKGRLSNLLKSSDVKKLEEKYGSQINKFKEFR